MFGVGNAVYVNNLRCFVGLHDVEEYDVQKVVVSLISYGTSANLF